MQESGPVAPAISLGGDTGSPLHTRLEQELRAAIRAGALPAGERLPSTRALAAQLGISRGVVAATYAQLVADGYLVTRQGAAHRVSEAVRGTPTRPPARPLASGFAYDLRPAPDPAHFPRTRWLRSLGDAWAHAPAATLADLDPRGLPQLRDALAAYLGRARGAAADPELTVVCAGFAQGFSLACRCLRAHGVTRIAVEDPGYHQHRLIAEQSELDAVPVPVDGGGIDIGALEATGVTAVVVTPSHQFPTGPVLGPARRAALVEWAERCDAVIVEDDYDSELRFDGLTVGMLQGLAPERVLGIGSASKRLAPGLRLGWMLVPSWLTWPIVTAKAVEDRGSEVPGQLALADFVTRGELGRHLRRMRAIYASRRNAFLAAVREQGLDLRVRDDPAGVAELVELPASVDEAAVLAAAAARGIGLEGLGMHRVRDEGPGGLVVGYAAQPEPVIARVVQQLAEIIRA